MALGARRRFRVRKIARNWTFQGEVYILLKDNPNPIHVASEADFPESTKLDDGEGMLPKEMPLRRQRPTFVPDQNQTQYRGGIRNQRGPSNHSYGPMGNRGPSQENGPPTATYAYDPTISSTAVKSTTRKSGKSATVFG